MGARIHSMTISTRSSSMLARDSVLSCSLRCVGNEHVSNAAVYPHQVTDTKYVLLLCTLWRRLRRDCNRTQQCIRR
jgi:hypothetical protein